MKGIVLTLLVVLFLAPARGDIVSGGVFPHQDGVLVVAGWADVDTTTPLAMSVYSQTGLWPEYEGEALCQSSFCSYWDTEPNPVYWFVEDGQVYGPIAWAIRIPDSLWDYEGTMENWIWVWAVWFVGVMGGVALSLLVAAVTVRMLERQEDRDG